MKIRTLEILFPLSLLIVAIVLAIIFRYEVFNMRGHPFRYDRWTGKIEMIEP